MTTSLQDLVTPKTRDDVVADELTTATSEGLQTTTWQVGSVIRTVLVIVAQSVSDLSTVIIEPIKGGFGDLLSSLPWATVWAKGQFNVDAITALPATGAITITNPTSKAYQQAAGELIVAHSVTGKTYRNVATVTIPASSTVTDVQISSEGVGTSNNAAPGFVTVLVGPSMDGVTITNPLAVLGADDETVSALVTRSRESLGALSPNGPKDAYNYVAKTPALSPTATPITKAVTFLDAGSGDVAVYLATADGSPVPSDVAIVQTGIDTYAEPWGTDAFAVAADNVAIDVTYTVWVKTTSLTTAQITSAIATALSVFFSGTETNPIGGIVTPPATGFVYADSLIVAITTATLSNGTTLGIVRADLTLPTADVAIAKNQVAVLGTVTAAVNFL
jgi:hypothetical protein